MRSSALPTCFAHDFGVEPNPTDKALSPELCRSKLRFVDRYNLRYRCRHYRRAPGGGWEVDVGREVRVLRPGAITAARGKISERSAGCRRHGSAEPEVFFAVAMGTCDHHQLHALGLHRLGCLASLVANEHRRRGAFIDRACAANARFRRDRARRYASTRTKRLSCDHSRPSWREDFRLPTSQ